MIVVVFKPVGFEILCYTALDNEYCGFPAMINNEIDRFGVFIQTVSTY